MDAIDAARHLGEEIQRDVRYINFRQAQLANEENAELQEAIAKFNRIRGELKSELETQSGISVRADSLKGELKAVYAQIVNSDGMKEYNRAKQELDELKNAINSIIAQCFAGGDPQTCSPASASCNGSCEGCSGCC